MDFDLVIRGGQVITASDRVFTDVGVRDGKIAALGKNLQGERSLDADGLLVLPGAIDPHVHLEMDAGAVTSSDDFKTGTMAAAYGGTTSIIDFVEAGPGESMLDALDKRRASAEKSVLDYSFHMTLDKTDDESLKEIPKVISSGVTSFKAYTTYGFMLNDEELVRGMAAVGVTGGIVIVHCENDAIVQYHRKRLLESGETGPSAHPKSRPAVAEGEAVERVLSLAAAVNASVYIVHISTALGAQAVERARGRKQVAFGETCPQYLFLDEAGYELPDFEGAKFICSPPLRTKEDNKSLWKALSYDVVQTVGTDHCPFFFKGQKEVGRGDFTKIPGGLPGIEGRLALLYQGVNDGKIDVNRWVEISSTNPAKIFGLYPRKGSLLPGADADIVLFDPQKKVTLTHEILHENVDYTPYEGIELSGYPVTTIRRGEILVQDGKFIGTSKGEFLRRNLPLYK